VFGRRHAPGNVEARELEVDHRLEDDIGGVIRAVDAYLAGTTDPHRQQLLVELEALDGQVDSSEAYDQGIGGLRGIVPNPDVVGETGPTPIAEDVQQGEFDAQGVLVRAAKAEVTTPSPSNLAALHAARQRLAAVRAGDVGASAPPPDPGPA